MDPLAGRLRLALDGGPQRLPVVSVDASGSPAARRPVARGARQRHCRARARAVTPVESLVVALRRCSGRCPELDFALEIGEELQMLFDHAAGELGDVDEIT